MWKLNILIFLAYCLSSTLAGAQPCHITVNGVVTDETTGFPLTHVHVLVQEETRGAVTDDAGRFFLDSLCRGEYHLVLSHMGCEPVHLHLDVRKDTLLKIEMLHTVTTLGTVVIQGEKDAFNNQPNTSVNRRQIEESTGKNLSNLLADETGVYTIKSGSGISKPIVHGLYGNRLTILNNGIAQSGQQWGNDHSPEIDPFVADKITVLKGAAAIEYGGENLGSYILVEPRKISNEPHLHGQVNYAFESNGRGQNLNTRLEKKLTEWALRFNGTLRKYGDRRSSSYFLNNTGIREHNLSVQAERSWNQKLFLELYTSTFNTTLGILRGSHIGNLTDLEDALERDVPFFTDEGFSYEIEAPKQAVSHHLAKARLKYYIKDNEVIDLVIAGQRNERKEFDVRRSGRTDIPALSLLQYTLNTEVKYSKEWQTWKIKSGILGILTDNTNNPETGILPLIPDYLSAQIGAFQMVSKKWNHLTVETGLRYDFTRQSVVAISQSVPYVIERFTNRFHNLSGLISVKYEAGNRHTFVFSTGLAGRNPAINELYSNGLHQGVSGIEEGDLTLKTERAIKNTLEYIWKPHSNFSLSTLAYHQKFKDYIFLKPQEEIRLTIRGAFPVFRYAQTDATIYGLDVSSQFSLGRSLIGRIKYSYLKGQDKNHNEPLIFMPPNRVFTGLTYQIDRSIALFGKMVIRESEIEISNRYVFKQNHIRPEQDFLPPPPGYNLLGLKLSTQIFVTGHKFRFFIHADNVLNTEYRDYLNRLRYFADDQGRSLTVGLQWKF